MSSSNSDQILPLYNSNARSVSPFQSDSKSRTHTPHHKPQQASLSPLSNVSLDHHDHGITTTQALPKSDRPQFAILVILYMIQGVPIGLAFGSIPFLLKSYNLSYSQVGIFSLASYPYSFKLVYSPIVDSIFFERVGRRKSWIIPVQFISGITLLVLSNRVDSLLSHIETSLPALTVAFFGLIFLCATQDIAVDGWALTILSPGALSYASTAQTIGLNCGYFLSFTVFLAFNSPEFANKYFRSQPLDVGVITLPQYLRLCGCVFIIVTLIVAIYVPEQPKNLDPGVKKTDDIELVMNPMDHTVIASSSSSSSQLQSSSPIQNLKNVYIKMYQVLKLPNLKIFIVLHLISKIGFQTNEAATNLKLLEKGFSKENLAITVLIDFPFEIIFGYYAGRWSTGDEPLRPWLYAFLGRIVAACCAQLLVLAFPQNGVNSFYFVLVILQHLLGSFMSTVQFVSICAFHTKIADPLIGGTYMTTLNTLSNLGGQWPKIIVLYAIDRFTIAHCESAQDKSMFKDEIFYQCSTGNSKTQCIDAGGECNVLRDGYYYTNFVCITVGLLTYFLWIKKTAKHLQQLPPHSWRVKNS